MTLPITTLSFAIALLLAMAPTASGAAAPFEGARGAVDTCTSGVDVDWQDLAFDPDDDDATKANWFVRTIATSTDDAGCAGVAQTLTLLDRDGTVIFEETSVLDEAGRGTFHDVAVRAEDIWNVQVLLRADAGPAGESAGDVDAGSVERDGARAAGELPVTGMALRVLAGLGALLLCVGTLARQARRSP